MEYTRLGNSGLQVSRICLGCGSFGHTQWNGWAVEDDRALSIIKKAYDAGINFFDTSNSYSNGQSEVLLGKAIEKYNFERERIVVTTKVGFAVKEGDSSPITTVRQQAIQSDIVNRQGLSRKNIFQSCEASLRRLGLDYIDLYQIHFFDPHTPIRETMEALHDLVKAGKVRYIGASNAVAWRLQKANHVAEMHGYTKFISVQNLYNLLQREDEREVIPYSMDAGVGGLPWSPLAMGKLASKHRNTMRSQNDQFTHILSPMESDEHIIDRVVEIAEKRSRSPAQIAVAWLLSKPFVTAPVVGATKVEHLDDLIGALSVKLTDEECRHLEEHYTARPCRNT